VGGALSYEITGFLLVLRRNPTASETVLDRSVGCIVGNGLDDVHDLLRQPAAADGGHAVRSISTATGRSLITRAFISILQG